MEKCASRSTLMYDVILVDGSTKVLGDKLKCRRELLEKNVLGTSKTKTGFFRVQVLKRYKRIM